MDGGVANTTRSVAGARSTQRARARAKPPYLHQARGAQSHVRYGNVLPPPAHRPPKDA